MLRLMTMMLVLCVPTVSFADIFFCQSENGSLLISSSNTVLKSELIEDKSLGFVVDTEKGFTTTATASRIYSGGCRAKDYIIDCTSVTSILQINLLNNSLAQASLMFGGLVNSVTGTCTKA